MANDFWSFIDNNLANKPAVLALKAAACYSGLTSPVPDEIVVYVESRIPELNNIKSENFKIKQIKISSLDKIEYTTDKYGVKCSSAEQIVYDILKRSYRSWIKYGIWIIGYDYFRIVDDYFLVIDDTFSKFKLPPRYKKILDKHIQKINSY